MTYKLKRHRLFTDEWNQLALAIKQQLKKKLAKVLENPHIPKNHLGGELSGFYKIKLRKAGIRLVYQVKDDELIIILLTVGKREDSLVYRIAQNRIDDDEEKS